MSYEQELIAGGTCPDLVWRLTEDGLVDGRCGLPLFSVTIDGETVAFACEGHTEERLQWQRMTEAQKAAWERHHDIG